LLELEIMEDVSAWFRALPQFTRYWFGGTVALSLLGRFGIVSPYYLILEYHDVFHNFQLWRLLTCLLFYPISPKTGFHFLINLYFLINYSKLLETGVFATRPADYALLLLFNWVMCLIAGIFMNMMVLMDPMVLSVLYVWCMLNKDTIVTFWFGTQFKAMYLPWVLFGFNMILSGGGMAELIGIRRTSLLLLKIRLPSSAWRTTTIEYASISGKLLSTNPRRNGWFRSSTARSTCCTQSWGRRRWWRRGWWWWRWIHLGSWSSSGQPRVKLHICTKSLKK